MYNSLTILENLSTIISSCEIVMEIIWHCVWYFLRLEMIVIEQIIVENFRRWFEYICR